MSDSDRFNRGQRGRYRNSESEGGLGTKTFVIFCTCTKADAIMNLAETMPGVHIYFETGNLK
ncbi:MAG: hypothetical protein GY749_36295 [Desulfobacteraceae bacterium]|nr:hypothetical protein [Desulfobacteraceae bacterium]